MYKTLDQEIMEIFKKRGINIKLTVGAVPIVDGDNKVTGSKMRWLVEEV